VTAIGNDVLILSNDIESLFFSFSFFLTIRNVNIFVTSSMKNCVESYRMSSRCDYDRHEQKWV